jgi:hypothetical protein
LIDGRLGPHAAAVATDDALHGRQADARVESVKRDDRNAAWFMSKPAPLSRTQKLGSSRPSSM